MTDEKPLDPSHPCSHFNTDVAGPFDKVARALLEESVDRATGRAAIAIRHVFSAELADGSSAVDFAEDDWDRLWEEIRRAIILLLDHQTQLV